MIICIEGIDGAGKTTLAEKVASFTGTRLVREPGGTEIGEEIRAILKKGVENPFTQLFLFLASRAELMNHIIGEKNLIFDRFSPSTFVYNDVLPKESLRLLTNLAQKGNQVIDLYFWIDVDPETALQRILQRGEVDTLENLREKREKYRAFFADVKHVKLGADLEENFISVLYHAFGMDYEFYKDDERVYTLESGMRVFKR